MECDFCGHYVYGDNLGVMGCSRDEVARVLSEVSLEVHGLEMSGGEMKALGVELDSRLLRNFRDLREVLEASRSAQSSLVERKGERRHVRGVGSYWPSVGTSGTSAVGSRRAAMPLLASDWWLRWNLLVSASDAVSEWV